MHTELKLQDVNSERFLLGYIERRLNFVLGRFAPRIGKVTVRIRGVSDSRPQAVRCRMGLDLHPFGLVETEATDTELFTAVDRCAGRLARRCEAKCGRARNGRSNRLTIRIPDSMPLAG